VKAGLEKLVNATGADEVIAVTDLYEHADRLESYRRLAGVAKSIGEAPTRIFADQDSVYEIR
jgi:hypothetical protein